jgi:hypothetical protein
MGPRPWKPAVELDGALDRGDLRYAITLAKEVSERRPIDLDLALRFLPLVAVQQTAEYDAWARRWLIRWLGERPTTIEQAAEVAATLADLPAEPMAVEAIRQMTRSR